MNIRKNGIGIQARLTVQPNLGLVVEIGSGGLLMGGRVIQLSKST